MTFDQKDQRRPKQRVRTKERTIVIEAGSTASLPMTVGPSDLEPRPSSWSRLDHLYRITKLLVNFESIEKTVGAILGVVTNTLPLRSALLIDETAGYARVFVWNGEGMSEQKLRSARSHAIAMYAYLAGSHPTLETVETDIRMVREEPLSQFLEKDRNGDKKFTVIIPLVVDRRPIFGAFQLVCAAALNETDLMFVNAVANQLAVALDRHKVLQQEIAARGRADAAGRRMQFLADASKVLAGSFNSRGIWESLARLAVPEIADCCVVDTLEDQSLRRITVISPDLPTNITQHKVERALTAVVKHVLKTRRSVIHPAPPGDPEAEKEEAANAERSFESYMCVPLLISESSRGTLTLVSTTNRLYERSDLVLIEDLARRAVMAFENAELYANALQAIRNRDDVLNAVSHDLKGPLTVVLGFINVFLSKAAPEEPLICDRKQVEAIQRSAKQMNALINDLLDTASIRANHLCVEPVACPVVPLIDEAMDLSKVSTAGNGLLLKRDVAPDLPPILVDRHRILQVLNNLIGNAIKFTPPGGAVTVRAQQTEDDIQFCIEDTGPGIAQDEIPYIFDRFWQARKTARLGTGLGLFIVKGIVEAHGGRVWVESKLGAGSKFFFTLPLNR
jgi:signal transduction histidine kinase